MAENRVAVIAVRMDSERLPGKTLKVVNGKPLLAHLIDRVKASNYINDIIVATSIDANDDEIERFCINNKIKIFRGDKLNVLSRIKNALISVNADIGVNIYGDGPIICPEIIDYIVLTHQFSTYDFVCNNLETTFSPGMEVEVFHIDALCKAFELAMLPEQKEHATLFIRHNPSLFSIHNVRAEGIYYKPNYYLEVDETVDLFLVEKIMRYQIDKNDFSFSCINNFFIENVDISKVNQNVYRKWVKFRAD